MQNVSNIFSYELLGILLFVLIIGLIVGGIVLSLPILWIIGILLILSILIWSILLALEASKAFGKDIFKIFQKFFFQKQK